jgi:hypothetical protein
LAAVYVVVYSQVLAVSPQQGESAVSIFKMFAAFWSATKSVLKLIA